MAGVTFKKSNGRLQLYIGYFAIEDGQRVAKRKYLSTGLEDSKIARHGVMRVKLAIEKDLAYGQLDTTWQKYELMLYPERAEPKKQTPKETIATLWQRYRAFKERLEPSPNTVRTVYEPVDKLISKLPTVQIESAQAIRDYLLANYSVGSAKRLLLQLNACCNWSVGNGYIPSNPFAGMKITLPKAKRKTQQIEAFTYEQALTIIQAFKDSQYYAHYWQLIYFLFHTGTRPSEAIALTWNDIKSKYIVLNKSIAIGTNGIELKQGLKTQESRQFPINNQLKAFLNEIKPRGCNPDSLVFPAKNGSYINEANLNRRAWKETLATLPELPQISLYHTRHSFITHCLELGISPKDIQVWCGNSALVIFRNYANPKKCAPPAFESHPHNNMLQS